MLKFKKSVKIAGTLIDEKSPVFIIAEAGVNHNGDLDMARALVDSAKRAGCDAVKFQSFKAENLVVRKAPKARYHKETTRGEDSWFDILKTQELDGPFHRQLIKHCLKKDIIFLSTPYDFESADLLDELNVPAFKIAATDSNNTPFLRYIARKRRPVILSTGMCDMAEIKCSLRAIREGGCKDLILLHCTSNYPQALEDSNLRAMATMKDAFGCLVGYSDHSHGFVTAVATVALGARVFEKHITLDKNLPGPDHRFAFMPDELSELVSLIRDTEKAMGKREKICTKSEYKNSKILRKSIVSKVDIPKDTIINRDMLVIKRPGTGIKPEELDKILGSRSKRRIRKDSVIKYDHLIKRG